MNLGIYKDFLKILIPNPLYGNNSSQGSSSHNSTSNTTPHKRNNGKKHVCQICEKVGHQTSRCFVIHDLFNTTYKSGKLPSASPFAHTSNTRFPSASSSHIPNATLYTGTKGVSVGNGKTLSIHYFVLLTMSLLNFILTVSLLRSFQ